MKMVLTANGAGGVVIPNLPNEPKLSDTFRVTVDAPNIPLTLTAPNDVAFSSQTSVLITAGYVNARSGKALALTAKWNSNLLSVTHRFPLVAISLLTVKRTASVAMPSSMLAPSSTSGRPETLSSNRLAMLTKSVELLIRSSRQPRQ